MSQFECPAPLINRTTCAQGYSPATSRVRAHTLNRGRIVRWRRPAQRRAGTTSRPRRSLRHALAVGVHDREIILCVGAAPKHSEAKPFHGFGVILRHALAVVIHQTESVQRVGVALLSSEPKPLHGLSVILRHTSAVVPYRAPRRSCALARP